MRISFCLPHVFQPASIPEENSRVRAILDTCLNELTRGSASTHVVPSLKRTGQTRVTFEMPHVFNAVSLPHENAIALQSLLRCLCDIDSIYLNYHQVAPLYQSGVYYDRTQIWDCTPALYNRKYGDCKSVSCTLIAEYKAQGIPCKPVFRWVATEKGTTNYHILVQTPMGFEDPSKVLGMGQNENAYFKQTG